jgi:hypothetical protein
MIIETNGNMSCNSGGAAANASMGARNEALEAKIKRLAEEIIDMAVNNSIDKCCDLVMAESDEEMVDGRVEDAISDVQAGMLTEVSELPLLAAASSRVSEADDRPATIAPQVVAHKRQVEDPQLEGLPAAVGATKGVQPTTVPSAPMCVTHVRETSQCGGGG